MIKDFVFAAWPWVALGLSIATVLALVVRMRKTKGNAPSKIPLSTGYYVASFLMYSNVIIGLVADGEMSSGNIVWLCLGATYMCIGADQKRRESDEEKTNFD